MIFFVICAQHCLPEVGRIIWSPWIGLKRKIYNIIDICIYYIYNTMVLTHVRNGIERSSCKRAKKQFRGIRSKLKLLWPFSGNTLLDSQEILRRIHRYHFNNCHGGWRYLQVIIERIYAVVDIRVVIVGLTKPTSSANFQPKVLLSNFSRFSSHLFNFS